MNIGMNNLKWYGRNFDYNKVRYFNYSCSGFEFCMTGKKAVATILSDPNKQKKAERGVIGVYVKELKSETEYNVVEYYLTDIGYSLRPVVESMQKWGKDYKKLRKLMERAGL